ncbi:unnamed protein product [Didymodactylos carnosus]|uniref:Small nuclear ribonucleoprotein Prp3 C-terminal domain-containing protein n=1 Tax=Didymodactylos carnosus TaxID=1234261 RepID=A0A814K9P0_9BILA|nr:unnamed protein product [Didymodactylos carnosus]CAF3817735.1 unnamed protein product [Didymodactylos carnosus]
MEIIRGFVEQLNEIEILQSFYSLPGEFVIDDLIAFDEANAFVSGKIKSIERKVSFIIKLNIDDQFTEHIEECGEKRTIELQIAYPSQYPLLSPDVCLQQLITKQSRLWIYSHHIYNIAKRRHIVNWENELRLCGFSLPSKPGNNIMIEGDDIDVNTFWSRLRSLQWKRLQIKEKEDIENDDKKFDNFEELS